MKKIAIFIISALVFMACEDPNEGNIEPTVSGYPIATWLDQNPEEFSEWVNLLIHADLYSTMNLSKDYTAFVPDNDAVVAYLREKGYESVESIPKADAVVLIKFHTIAGVKYEYDKFTNGVLPDTTASGDNLSLRFGEEAQVFVNGVAEVKDTDLPVTNGVLHSLKAVLHPVTSTIWETVNTSEYSIMAEALTLTGYDELLNTVRLGNLRVQYTLLAVPNTVFNAEGINSVTELISELEAGDDYTNVDNALNKFVAYHIFDQLWDQSQFSTFSGQEASKNIPPMAKGELINVSLQNMALYFNYDASTEKGISIVAADLSAKNGLLQVLDNPMFLHVPAQATVIWELTDYAQIAEFTSDYRKSNLSETKNVVLDPDKVDFFEWETIIAPNRFNAVKYSAYRNTEGQWWFMNHDGLTLQLRAYGWIQATTPTIVKGEYEIKVQHYSKSGSSKTGNINIIIDGVSIGSDVPTLGYSSTTPDIYKTTVGKVNFVETGTHTFRILQTDNSEIYLDYIEFTPID